MDMTKRIIELAEPRSPYGPMHFFPWLPSTNPVWVQISVGLFSAWSNT